MVNTLNQIRPELGVRQECAFVCAFQKEDLGKQQWETALYWHHHRENEVGKKRGEKDGIRGKHPSQSTVGRCAEESRDRWE